MTKLREKFAEFFENNSDYVPTGEENPTDEKHWLGSCHSRHGWTLIATHEQWDDEPALACDACGFVVATDEKWIDELLLNHETLCFQRVVTPVACMPLDFLYGTKNED